MSVGFSRPSTGARWLLDRTCEPYGSRKTFRLNIQASGRFTVVDALEFAEMITYEARRAEELNLNECCGA